MEMYSTLLPDVTDYEQYHTLHLLSQEIKQQYGAYFKRKKQQKEKREKILKERNHYKDIIEVEKEQKKCIKMESEDDVLVDCTLQWLNMLTKAQKEKVVDSIMKLQQVKIEPKPSSTSQEPFVPPPGKFRKEKPAEKIMEEEEEEKKKMENAVEAAGKKSVDDDMDTTTGDSTQVGKKEEDKSASSSKEVEAEKIIYRGVDVTKCERTSALRRLKECFPGYHHDDWSGFYNKGFPYPAQHHHMFWRKKYRQPSEPRGEHWHEIDENKLMDEYIKRRMNEELVQQLIDIAGVTCYECDDPQLHQIYQKEVEKRTEVSKQGLRNPDFSDRGTPA